MKKIIITALAALFAMPLTMQAKQQYKAVKIKFVAPVSVAAADTYVKTQKSQLGNHLIVLTSNDAVTTPPYKVTDISGVRVAVLDMSTQVNPDSGIVRSTRRWVETIQNSAKTDLIIAQFATGTQQDMQAVASKVQGLNIVVCESGNEAYSGFLMKELEESDANPFFFINKDGSVDHPVSLSKTDSTLIVCPGNNMENVAEASVIFGVSKGQILGKIAEGNLITTSNQPLDNKFVRPVIKTELLDELKK